MDGAESAERGDRSGGGGKSGRSDKRDSGGGKEGGGGKGSHEGGDGSRSYTNRAAKGGRGGKGYTGRSARTSEAGEPEADGGGDSYSRRGDRSEKAGRGQGHSREYGGRNGKLQPTNIPMLVGPPVTSALRGVPAARGGPMQCLLCRTDAPTYVSIGPCGHADTCWVCALRLRHFAQDRKCTVCKEEAAEIMITDDATLPFPRAQGLNNLPVDISTGVRFANSTIQRACMRLLEYRCQFDRCGQNHASVAFPTLHEMENHLWYTHWRQFCKTCLHGRTAFVFEQEVFEQKDMQRHCQNHSWCEFCREYLFDEDQLHYHMNEKHHLCAICESIGQRNHFYANFVALATHYADSHHVCAHPSCTHAGHRLTVFTSDDELQLHMIKEHTDKSNMTEKERKELIRPLLQVGVRSYADEQRAAQAAKGGARGEQSSASDARAVAAVTAIRFCWPTNCKQESSVACKEAQDAEAAARYPEREVFSDQEDALAVGETQGDAENASDNGNEDAASSEEDASSGLQPKVLALSLDVSVATSGRQEGMRSMLDAFFAVLKAMLGIPTISPEDASYKALRALVEKHGLVEVETIERLRKDLDSCGLDESYDWEPLERVLALRPLFFRLLRSVVGGRGRTIGPAASGNSSEEAWKAWKVAAQATVESLGKMERQWLFTYVHFCIRHRAFLSGRTGAAAPDLPAAALPKETTAEVPIFEDQSFPTLGGEPAPAGGAVGPAITSDWGKKAKQQGPPSIHNGWSASPPDPAFAAKEPAAEAFPALGTGIRATPTAGWSAAAGKAGGPAKQPAVSASAASEAKASQQAAKVSVQFDFPSLGGASTAGKATPATTDTNSWGAQARERERAAAAAKSEPQRPKVEVKKVFKVEEELFPELPMGAPAQKKPSKAELAAKAKAATKAKAAARANAAAADPPAAAVKEEEPVVQLVPDDQLILITNPLDAIAKTEAEEAERRARKASNKKPGGNRKGYINPWTVGSPSVER